MVRGSIGEAAERGFTLVELIVTMIVVGILAVPEDTEIKGEHQYVASGAKLVDGMIRLGIATESGVIDRTKEAAGYAAGQLLSEPIWQC